MKNEYECGSLYKLFKATLLQKYLSLYGYTPVDTCMGSHNAESTRYIAFNPAGQLAYALLLPNMGVAGIVEVE